MIDEKGLLNLSVGDRDKYAELIRALIPGDDLRQRSDFSVDHVKALTWLLYVGSTYNCDRILVVCEQFMNLRISHDRKSRTELVSVFKRLFESYDGEVNERDAKFQEMTREK